MTDCLQVNCYTTGTSLFNELPTVRHLHAWNRLHPKINLPPAESFLLANTDQLHEMITSHDLIRFYIMLSNRYLVVQRANTSDVGPFQKKSPFTSCTCSTSLDFVFGLHWCINICTYWTKNISWYHIYFSIKPSILTSYALLHIWLIAIRNNCKTNVFNEQVI